MNILTWDGLADIDSFHGERVMIIDDNEINLEVMQTIFNDFWIAYRCVCEWTESIRKLSE